ncbi:hypothetical protein JX266_011886 [Neoarthrinium moseri]|nr:hypothetical protein JX266_011886 [Neoarthrinium moseri]
MPTKTTVHSSITTPRLARPTGLKTKGTKETKKPSRTSPPQGRSLGGLKPKVCGLPVHALAHPQARLLRTLDALVRWAIVPLPTAHTRRAPVEPASPSCQFTTIPFRVQASSIFILQLSPRHAGIFSLTEGPSAAPYPQEAPDLHIPIHSHHLRTAPGCTSHGLLYVQRTNEQRPPSEETPGHNHKAILHTLPGEPSTRHFHPPRGFNISRSRMRQTHSPHTPALST